MRKKTVAIAESCTGGLLGEMITRTAGASSYFRGGVLAYHNDVKHALLGVPQGVLVRKGAVSEAVARLMARNVRKRLRTTIGVAITGIAGPGGGTRKKPVGLVYIALSKGAKTSCRKFLFKGSRRKIRERSAKKALNWLKKEL